MFKYFSLVIPFLFLFSHIALGDEFAKNFQDYSGLSGEAIPKDSNSYSKEWNTLKISEGTKDIDIQLLYDLNLEATSIWTQLVDCNHGDAEIARANYFSKDSNDLCKNKEMSHNVYEKIVQLTENLLSIADSNKYVAWFNAEFSLPPLHPLLSQKALEVLATNRIRLSNWYLGNMSAFSIQLEALRCVLAGIDCDKERTPFLKSYAFFSRLLSRGSSHCFNYGLWPTQALYLFARWDRDKGISYQLPYKDQLGISKENNYSFHFKGGQIHYIEIGAHRDQATLPNFIVIPPFNNRLSKNEIRTAVLNHQRQRHHFVLNSGNSSQSAECWQGANVIKHHISQFPGRNEFEDRLVPYIQQYHQLFEFYSQDL